MAQSADTIFEPEALVRVRTTGDGGEPLDFMARVVGSASHTHLRIRTADGLIFAVPASDCDAQREDG
jgi:hypothetical protein